MKSVLVKFRNLLAARFALFTVCALTLAGCETDWHRPDGGDAPRAVTSARPDSSAADTGSPCREFRTDDALARGTGMLDANREEQRARKYR